MAERPDEDAPEAAPERARLGTAELSTGELLVEEVSIDGMCGVY